MNKRISSFTVVLWSLAGVYVFLLLPEIALALTQPYNAAREIFGLVRGAIWGAGGLFAFGVIIEQIDCIRWKANTRETPSAS